MHIRLLVALSMTFAAAAYCLELQFKEHKQGLLLTGDSKPWMDTITQAPETSASKDGPRVYTQLFDLQRFTPITGSGDGEFPHQRGLFLGWASVTAQDKTYDFWAMKGVRQEHAKWEAVTVDADRATQVEKILWNDAAGKTLIEETRSLTASPGPDNTRVLDLQTTLVSKAGAIQLRGDAHHAGVQIRMASEVATHEASTRFTLPDNAQAKGDDVVAGANWACCSAVVRNTRYWVMHMTPPSHPGGAPLYAVRSYGRFGAAFDADLVADTPVTYKFRIVISGKELSQSECNQTYQRYASENAPAAPPKADAHAAPGPATEETKPLRPDEVLVQLKNGNTRFISGTSVHPNQNKERLTLTAEKGQHPIATIVGCSDSREPLEVLFDRGVGDLFVVRVAGNVCDVDEIGSVEYGVGHLHTPLLLILGHTKCGAVTAVAKNAEVGGSIPQLVDNIKPAVEAARKADPKLDGDALIPPAIKANVFQSIHDVFVHSKEVRELVHEGKLVVLGAIYHLDDGTIEWLGEHPQQKELLETKE